MKRISLIVISLSCAVAQLAPATEFHVAPNGNDANPGTAAQPFATPAKARDAARAATGSRTIHLAAGRYFLTEPLKLDDRDSGTIWRGEGRGASAEIYGGVPVTGWEKWKGDVWRAPVPKGQRFYNLIVDGRSATMAQTPDRSGGFGGGAWKINNGAVGVPKEWLNYDYSDAQVFAFVGCDWFSEMRAVLKPAPEANGTLPIDGGGDQFGGINGRFFIRGVLEFLDEPGEWCLKHQEGWLYYKPQSGTPADHLIVRPVAERLLEIRGRTPQDPARDIRVENVSLLGSDFALRWYLFAPGQDGSTPEPLQQGMVFAENAANLTISGCRLLAAGHSAVWLNHHARDCVVENCLIADAGFAGIYANGFMPGEGPFGSAAESDVNRGHRLENNFIYDCGRFVGGGCGIQFYQSGDSLITRNRIANMPRYGISVKGIRWGCIPKQLYGANITFDTHFDYIHSRKLRITGNEIHSVCRNSFDFGGIESWSPGRDNLWSNNALHDIDQTLDWNGWAHVLFADDASHWLTIRDNLIDHCHGGRLTGAFMMKSLNQVIENNFVADCTLGRVVTLSPYIEPGGNFTIRRNVFAADGAPLRYETSPDTFKAFPGTAGKLPDDVAGIREVDHNAIQPLDPANPNTLADHGVDVHSVFGDLMVNRKRPDWDLTFRDYSLADASPAWKTGFKAIDTTTIGLRADFPFDISAFTRRFATRRIQAEDYQRMHALRTQAGRGIYQMGAGSWAKYENMDFGKGVAKAIFSLDAVAGGDKKESERPFVRRYGNTVAAALPFKADTSVETITRWEISKPYTRAGKHGPDLFDEAFPPETGGGEWQPLLEPAASRAGIRGQPGVVDFDAAHGDGHANSCAYARASIHAPAGRTNATMTVSSGAGVKVWLNGSLIIAENHAGTFSETEKGIIKPGWNTILVKVNQDAAPWTARTAGQGNFWFKFGTVASSCGAIVSLPGLPTEERGEASGADSLVELRLDSPMGQVIGELKSGDTECPIKPTTGIHNLFLVFPGNQVQAVDWFTFTTSEQATR